MGNCISSGSTTAVILQESSVESDDELVDSTTQDVPTKASNVQWQSSPQSQGFYYHDEDVARSPKRRITLSPSNVQEQLSQSQSFNLPKKRKFVFDTAGSFKNSHSCLSFVSNRFSRASRLDETDSEEKSRCSDFGARINSNRTSQRNESKIKIYTSSSNVSKNLSVPFGYNSWLFAGADDIMRSSIICADDIFKGWSMSDPWQANRFLRFKYERIRAQTWDWARTTFGSDPGLHFSPECGIRRTDLHRRRTPIISAMSVSDDEARGVIRRRRKSPQYKTHCLKPKHITKFLRKVLIECSLFKGIESDDVAVRAIDEVIKDMYTMDLKRGSILVKQGEIGDAFFLVQYGQLEVLIECEDDPEKKPIKKATINAEDTVGEAALMYNMKRSATLRATEPTRVWVMEAKHFHNIRALIKRLTKNKIKDWHKFLSIIPLFSKLRPHELSNVTQACREVIYEPGETIVSRQQNAENDFYLILKGKALLMRDRKDSISICRNVKIGEGDFFMLETSRNETLNSVKAVSKVHCLKLLKDDYDFLLGPHKRNEDRDTSDCESEYSEEFTSEEELPKNYENRVPYKLDDFQPLAVAGVGNFGHVVLVKAVKGCKREVFALKLVEKNKVINTGQTEHIKNERRVMFLLDSPFTVKLFATYQDETCVYFLLEKVLGGELWSLLRRETTFNETTSRFYTACIVLALEHIHSFNIIYRDLKPENVLIAENGYAKVTDFGFAKKRNQSTSLCGTPEYLAPELITGGIQSFGVDWWCLGIFLYEMLVGEVPFRDSENRKLYEDIMESTPKLTERVSWESQELIHDFLEKNAFRRLGSGPRGAGEVKERIWFKKNFPEDVEPFCWNSLEMCKLEAPYKPELKDDEDCRHFNVLDQKQETTELSRVFDPSLYEWCREF